MKTYLSTLFSLLVLAALSGCGNEQFGTGGQSSSSSANSLTAFSYQACSNFTLIKPKVDVVYIVDDSASAASLTASLKDSIVKTVNTLSSEFDYRVIGTTLITGGVTDYNVMTNSTDLSGISPSKIISNPAGFGFFSTAQGGGYEQGLLKTYNFLNYHKGSLIRRESHLIVVLVSNGLDADIEAVVSGFGNQEIQMKSDGAAKMNTYQSNLLSVKNYLSSQQLRFISATAHSKCNSNYFPSLNSYVAMSKRIYQASNATDQNGSVRPDAYDLCSSGVSSLFSSINNAIKQILIPHEYKYWPITFADSNATVSLDDVKVTKVSPSNARTELVRGTDWTLRDFGSSTSVPTRVVPSSGENVTGRYFVEFSSNLKYPDCVLVTSVSLTEKFNWVVFPQKPIVPGAKVFVNGSEIPSSALGSSVSVFQTKDIKFSPASTPPVMKSGYFLEITDPNYFYKSGDSVTTQYTPSPI